MSQAAISVAMGAVAMASLVAALFFLRFWRQTHDTFFLLFLWHSPSMPRRELPLG